MVAKKRDYKAEYAKYQGTEEQKKKRAQRNKARWKLLAAIVPLSEMLKAI